MWIGKKDNQKNEKKVEWHSDMEDWLIYAKKNSSDLNGSNNEKEVIK